MTTLRNFESLANTMKDWSDTAGDHHWQAGCATEQLADENEALQAEVERLRETEKKLREITHSLKDDNANYFSRNLELKQERDQLKERLRHLQGLMASGVLYTYDELLRHDAEVIERAINDWDYKTLEGDIINVECIRDYALQLRQQAKEVQS